MTAPEPIPTAGRPSSGVCDIPGISQVCDTAGQALTAPFEWLAKGLAETAAWMYESVWHVFDTTTLVDVTAPGYLAVYNLTFGIGITLALLMFCLQLIAGLIRREPDAMRRAATGLARCILGSFLVITITAALLEITDQLCIAIVHATGNTTDDMGGRIAALVLGLTALNLTSPAVGTIVTMFLASLAVAAAGTVWFSLLLRKSLLLVAIVLAPIALSGQAWDATRAWLPRWAGFVLALILSKLVTTVILLVAVTQASAPIDFDLASIADPIAGIVLMFIAAFAPYLTYKFLAFTGLDTYHAISSEHEAKDALDRPIPLPSPPRATDIPRVLAGNPAPATDAASSSTDTTPGTGDTPGADGTPDTLPQPAGDGHADPKNPVPDTAGVPGSDGGTRGTIASKPAPPADGDASAEIVHGRGQDQAPVAEHAYNTKPPDSSRPAPASSGVGHAAVPETPGPEATIEPERPTSLPAKLYEPSEDGEQ